MEQFSMPCQFWEVRKVALTVRATEREGHVLHRAERQKTLEVQEGQPGGSSILSAEGQGLGLLRAEIEGDSHDSWPGLTVIEVQLFFLHSSAKPSGLKTLAEQLLSSVVT